MGSRNTNLQDNYSKRHEVERTCKRKKCLIIKHLTVIQATDNYLRKQKYIF